MNMPTHAGLAENSQVHALSLLNKAAADELRLHILRTLRRDSFGVGELCEIFAIQQPAMSHHLKVLAQSQLVATRREGNNIFYQRAAAALQAWLQPLNDCLFETADQLPLPAPVEKRLKAIQDKRAQLSRQFFNDNVSKFTTQQELIADYPVYATPVAELVQQLDAQQRRSVLEIGPGSGEFLAELATLFTQVIALDISEEMLNQAKTFAKAQCLKNTRFLLGDSKLALKKGINVQAIVMHMVLHHVASPADLFADATALLTDDGHLFVADLCEHSQDWVRQACGDLWLGFAPDELSQWALRAGLSEVREGQYFSLRNGFRLQVRHFQKSTV
ncbi:MAG: metalloregulator ArsR/SmtB family transcription factor [Pseudomonadales bacterium]